MKYTKEDEKIIKELMEHLYEKHQKTSGGTMSGGNFFTEFLHGFVTPFKSLSGVFDLIKPGAGDFVRNAAESVDKMIPGARYDSIGDVFAGKKIAGTGRGRPKKATQPSTSTPVKRRVGRPCSLKN